MTNPINKDELRRLAESATPGPWTVAGTDQDNQIRIRSLDYEVCEVWNDLLPEELHGPQTAAFIAAANPATIIDLLNASDAKEEECRRLREALEEIKILALSIISGANRIS